MGKLIPEGPLKTFLRNSKSKAISGIGTCIPEGYLKSSLRLWIFRCGQSVNLSYLLNRGDVATLVGTPFPDKIARISHCVGSSGRVILIEPEKKNLERHYFHIARRGLNNLTIVPKAAFDHKGKAKFLIAPLPSDHRIDIPEIEHDNDYREANYYIDEVEVDVDTIDNIMRDLGVQRLDFVEIAVNGAEMHILLGMEQMLAVTQRLYVKGHARNRENRRPIHQDILPFLEVRGFRTWLTPPSKSVAKTVQWENREGDVFAWKDGENANSTTETLEAPSSNSKNAKGIFLKETTSA
jgi:FkbM family methyltransferase